LRYLSQKNKRINQR